MKTEHTPGQWKETGSSVWSDSRETCICVSISTKANAHLIAAAPDLLAFVQEWLDRQGTDENYMVSKARIAIAKAKGIV